VIKIGAAGFGVMLAVGVLAAAPADAVKDLSLKGQMPTTNVSLYGATHTIDNKSLDGKLSKGSGGVDAAATVPEPANWLMMLIGFGLLGAMNRRSNSDHLRDEMVL